jgi:hypothetical protein
MTTRPFIKEDLYWIADKIGKILNMDVPILHVTWEDEKDTDLARLYVQVGRFKKLLPRFVEHKFEYPAPPEDDIQFVDWYNGLEPTEQVGYWTSTLYYEMGDQFRVVPIHDLDDDHPYAYMDCYFLVFDRNWDDLE